MFSRARALSYLARSAPAFLHGPAAAPAIPSACFPAAPVLQRGFTASPVTSFIYRTLADVEARGTLKRAETGTWESRRYILRKDKFGFSFHHTVLYKGAPSQTPLRSPQ